MPFYQGLDHFSVRDFAVRPASGQLFGIIRYGRALNGVDGVGTAYGSHAAVFFLFGDRSGDAFSFMGGGHGSASFRHSRFLLFDCISCWYYTTETRSVQLVAGMFTVGSRSIAVGQKPRRCRNAVSRHMRENML